MKYAAIVCACLSLSLLAAAAEYPVQVLPAEHQKMTDPVTGTQLIFLTTNPAKDNNLYFHDRSWTGDGSVILFSSTRENGGLMGYIVQTGELLRLTSPTGALGGATAALNGCGFYAVRGREIVECKLNIEVSPDPAAAPSKATINERVICTVPEGVSTNTAVNENCESKYLCVGVNLADGPAIATAGIESGEFKIVCKAPSDWGYGGHVQFSSTNPNLISYAALKTRLIVIDTRNGEPKPVYKEWPGELVTHESWWLNDQLLFCGGIHSKPVEEAHVKTLNIYTGEVRIVGAGAWWEGAKPEELAKLNWWHSDGSDDGRWVVADNWHGDIMLWEGKTTRQRLLTTKHRTYGKGDHPHVGFDRAGKAVVFTSYMLGDENVCVAVIPQEWQDANK